MKSMRKRIKIMTAVMLTLIVLAGARMAQVVLAEPLDSMSEETPDVDIDAVNALENFEVSATVKEVDLVTRDLQEEDERQAQEAEIAAAREKAGMVVLDDGSVIYMTLDDIKEYLNIWFTDDEIRWVTQVVMAEDMIAYSDTIWAAHVWVILDRVGCDGFENNQDIYAVLSDRKQFPVWTEENLSAEPDERVERIVRDVMARFIYEQMGAPEELVGRVVPNDVHFFDTDGVSKYNHFYRYCWGGEYDPFDSPYNPYDN